MVSSNIVDGEYILALGWANHSSNNISVKGDCGSTVLISKIRILPH